MAEETTDLPLCKCGCLAEIREGQQFIRGHHGRKNPIIEIGEVVGVCACGCGEDLIFQAHNKHSGTLPKFKKNHTPWGGL